MIRLGFVQAKRYDGPLLEGPRSEIDNKSAAYPDMLRELQFPPSVLYVIGDLQSLRGGLSIVGARKATPYGRSCAERFAFQAAKQHVTIVSGGARGCDSAAHRGALKASGLTVAVLGGGCDQLYPAENAALFQQIIDQGGAVVSEHPWDFPAMPYTFRARNRIIAALSKATLIVEAGLPSGTFSTADEALQLGREVLVVPGSITTPNSRGVNRLLYQGALPVVDDESFREILASLFPQVQKGKENHLCTDEGSGHDFSSPLFDNPLIRAVIAEPLDAEAIYRLAAQYCGAENPSAWAALRIEEAQDAGLIARYPDDTYGPLL